MIFDQRPYLLAEPPFPADEIYALRAAPVIIPSMQPAVGWLVPALFFSAGVVNPHLHFPGFAVVPCVVGDEGGLLSFG